MKDVRADELAAWAKSIDPEIPRAGQLKSVSDDASFRRYFRFVDAALGRVFVDAPPEHEDNESFIKISEALIAGGLSSPEVVASDVGRGYLMVSDLGDELYLQRITEDSSSVGQLYDEAIAALLKMQAVQCDLPLYDQERLQAEMDLFHEWFIPQQLGLSYNRAIEEMLHQVYQHLLENALAQPQVFVHRDYHCRNLMVLPNNSPGIIDFQDAVTGPVTYDLVSLYKDCYYRFDRATVEAAVSAFHARLVEAEVVTQGAPMLRWFDLMGAQRHLKCAGIFSRLNLRDGKPGYLPDIPLVIDYLIEVSDLYEELADLGAWLQSEIRPLLAAEEYHR